MDKKRQKQAKSQTNTKIQQQNALRHPSGARIDNYKSQNLIDEDLNKQVPPHPYGLSNQTTEQQLSTLNNTNEYRRDGTIQHKSLDRTAFNSNLQSHLSYQPQKQMTTHLTRHGNEI